jgi:hypothetical protein
MRWGWIALLVVAGLAGGWHWWTSERPVARVPGIVAANDPVQQNLDPPPQFEARGHTFVARARYDITARVLRKEIYRLDGGAALAPVDLAVGWGPMSDSAIIDRLEFSQMGRFFYWKPRDAATFPLPPQVLVTSAAQMHMIPATKAIEDRLRKLRPGQLVTVGGWLVDVRGPGGFVWSTSLARDDTGNGACEIVWVESLAVDR